MTKIKICGITSLDDALCAAEAGADAIGFNFYSKSPRFIQPSDAGHIARRLEGRMEIFGVFVDASVDLILSAVEVAGLDVVQLHGNETVEFVSELRRFTNAKVIKALRADESFDPLHAQSFRADGLLLDAFVAGEFGGTGHTIDLKIAQEVNAVVPHLYLAGGLSVENVADAIRTVRPYAVDACSRLEVEPGRKDHGKVRNFISNVRAAL